MRRCKKAGYEATVSQQKKGIWVVSLMPYSVCKGHTWVHFVPHAPWFRVPQGTAVRTIIEKASKKLAKKGIHLPVKVQSNVGPLVY